MKWMLMYLVRQTNGSKIKGGVNSGVDKEKASENKLVVGEVERKGKSVLKTQNVQYRKLKIKLRDTKVGTKMQ